MMHFKSDELLNCYDCYQYENRLFVVTELMDGSLDAIIAKRHSSYSEKFVQYVCYKVLRGI